MKGSEGWWRVGATLHSDIFLTLSNLHRKSEGWRVFGNILRRSSAPYSKKQCKITKIPPHIQTFPHIFSFKSWDKQRMVLYLSNRGTNIQGHRVRYLGSLFRVDVPVLLISLIIIPDNLSTSGFGDLLWLCTCLLNLRALIILHLCKKSLIYNRSRQLFLIILWRRHWNLLYLHSILIK